MPFIQDARGMAATGLVMLIAWGVVVRAPFGRGTAAWVAAVLGTAALGLGIAALWLESDVLLIPFMSLIALLWVLAITIHSGEQAIHIHVPRASGASTTLP